MGYTAESSVYRITKCKGENRQKYSQLMYYGSRKNGEHEAKLLQMAYFPKKSKKNA